MLVEQGERCKICREPLGLKFGGKGNANHVDHRHGSQVVRGILCQRCNKGLGFFEHTPHLFERAGRYVRTDGNPDAWEAGASAGVL